MYSLQCAKAGLPDARLPTRWDASLPLITWADRVTLDARLQWELRRTELYSAESLLRTSTTTRKPWTGPPSAKERGNPLRIISKWQDRFTAKRQPDVNEERRRKNHRLTRESHCAKSGVGDLVLVKEAIITLEKEAINTVRTDYDDPNLLPIHFTGPQKVVSVIRKHLSFTVQINDRMIR